MESPKQMPQPASPLLPNHKSEAHETIPPPKFLPNWDEADFCTSPGSARYRVTRRRRREDETLSETLRSWLVQHQIGLAVNLILLLALTHICFPRARRRTRPFFELSYYNPSTGLYGQGPEDFYFIFFCVIVFTGLRAAVMTYCLLPLARRAGLVKRRAQDRFTEQAWLLVYYTFMCPLGLYVMYNSKYWFNLRELWTDFPHSWLTGIFKWYYLVQFGFWLQQFLVVHIEERRKDHWQMFTHHIFTSFLLLFSYGYYQTKVGNVVLVLMDVVDLALPVAKMLKYAGYTNLCDYAFGVFIITWIAARHVSYMAVVRSIWVHTPIVMTYGCYSSATGQMLSPDGGDEILRPVLSAYFSPGGEVCYNSRIQYIFLALLLALQGITLLWFAMICRLAWKVINGAGADDPRSDEEAEVSAGQEDEDVVVGEVVEHGKASAAPIAIEQPLEEYVGVEGLNLKRRSSPRFGARSKRGGSSSTGLAFAGSSDRKELLGRIGCDKPT